MIAVNNSLAELPTNLGGDPYPGEYKTLTVDYTYDTQQRHQVIQEYGYLFLP